eukprot:COSAG01_NODE_1931_length_8874_cov_108.307236_6_plen_76_part_00
MILCIASAASTLLWGHTHGPLSVIILNDAPCPPLTSHDASITTCFDAAGTTPPRSSRCALVFMMPECHLLATAPQ